MKLPEWAAGLIERFEINGFEAYAVGGCVRDMLLGNPPGDYDFTVSSLPEETKKGAEKGCRFMTPACATGTVTAAVGGHMAEITTYRTESGYSDFRRPDQVAFTRSLEEDLSHRDFTINAMAFHPQRGVVDCFGGQEDLKSKLLRCVGSLTSGFRRTPCGFSDAFGFPLCWALQWKKATGKALLSHKELCGKSRRKEFRRVFKLVFRPGAERVLTEYRQVIDVFLPEAGLRQEALDCLPPEGQLRLTGVFFRLYALGNGTSWKGFDTITRPYEPWRRWSNTAASPGKKQKPGAKIGKRPGGENHGRPSAFPPGAGAPGAVEEVRGQNLCCSLDQLAVSGRDLIRLGYPEGRKIGKTLDQLLALVLDKQSRTTGEFLLEKAESWLKQNS